MNIRRFTCLALVSVVGLVGCATARNYDDPSGPILVGPPVAPGPGGANVHAIST